MITVEELAHFQDNLRVILEAEQRYGLRFRQPKLTGELYRARWQLRRDMTIDPNGGVRISLLRGTSATWGILNLGGSGVFGRRFKTFFSVLYPWSIRAAHGVRKHEYNLRARGTYPFPFYWTVKNQKHQPRYKQ